MKIPYTLSRGNRICKNGRYTGYSLGRGSFSTTCDDRLDRWYIEDDESRVVDRRGAGFRTRSDALYALHESDLERSMSHADDEIS